MSTSSSLRRVAEAACRTAAVVLIASAPAGAQPLTFTFTAPAAGTEWRAGTTQTITWTLRAPTVAIGTAPVRLFYRLLPDGAWNEIGRTEAFRQRFEWRVPSRVHGQVAIRAMWATGPNAVVKDTPPFRVIGDMGGAVPEAGGSDYRIESVSFGDGRPLSEGLLYHEGAANHLPLRVVMAWNQLPPRAGIQCGHHTLNIFDRGGTILRTARVPDPGADGRMTLQLNVALPQGLRPGSDYGFVIRFRPGTRGCDAQATNNESAPRVRLLSMAGDDLVVRIVNARKAYDVHTTLYNLVVTYEVMNVSGTRRLDLVPVEFSIRNAPAFGTRATSVSGLEPGAWRREEHLVVAKSNRGLGGEFTLVVTVDPFNGIAELREDNNTDGKRFRW